MQTKIIHAKDRYFDEEIVAQALSPHARSYHVADAYLHLGRLSTTASDFRQAALEQLKKDLADTIVQREIGIGYNEWLYEGKENVAETGGTVAEARTPIASILMLVERALAAGKYGYAAYECAQAYHACLQTREFLHLEKITMKLRVCAGQLKRAGEIGLAMDVYMLMAKIIGHSSYAPYRHERELESVNAERRKLHEMHDEAHNQRLFSVVNRFLGPKKLSKMAGTTQSIYDHLELPINTRAPAANEPDYCASIDQEEKLCTGVVQWLGKQFGAQRGFLQVVMEWLDAPGSDRKEKLRGLIAACLSDDHAPAK